jgi:hypothetical protein
VSRKKSKCSWDMISVSKNVAQSKWEMDLDGKGQNYCALTQDTADEGGEIWWSCWAGKSHKVGSNQASIPAAKRAACEWLTLAKAALAVTDYLPWGLMVFVPVVAAVGYGVYKSSKA